MIFERLTEVLDPEPHGAALNMAIDEVLLRSALTPLLRVYRWERPALSFGYFEKFSELDPPPGWELVRRWTGGGVVAHGEDVTYTLIVPASHEFARQPAADSYRAIHGCIAQVLRAAGVEATLATATAEKISSGCFENAAEADVLAGARKIAGAAQRRTRWGLLHQGSVQGAALAEELGAKLATAFAREAISRRLTNTEFAQAQVLARDRYATGDWLRRFV